jgi:hypothetical protein
VFAKVAVDHPGHFRLVFRNGLVNRSDPRHAERSMKPGLRLGLAVAAYRGKRDVDLDRFDGAADVLCGAATLHGLANLVLEEKAPHYLKQANARDFVKNELPKVLERLYPN